MRITRENTEANVIRAWDDGRVLVGERWHAGNLIVAANAIVPDWPAASARELDVTDLAPAIELEPAIIVLGTGLDACEPDIGLMAELAGLGIGLEIMTTPAACRTYNVLVHENRRVVAALFTTVATSAGRS